MAPLTTCGIERARERERQGEIAEARAELEAAMSLARNRWASDGDVAAARTLVDTWTELAIFLERRGASEDATAQWRALRAKSSELAAQFDDRAPFRLAQIDALTHLATISVQAQDLAAAEEMLGEAATVAESADEDADTVSQRRLRERRRDALTAQADMRQQLERLPQATILSVGHRAELEAFHSRQLVLEWHPEGAHLVQADSWKKTFRRSARFLARRLNRAATAATTP